jgi:hypothetical protein
MSEWISVEDEMPQSGKEVLVYDYGIYRCTFWSHITDEWDCFDEPSHWMPLPDPPGEGE